MTMENEGPTGAPDSVRRRITGLGLTQGTVKGALFTAVIRLMMFVVVPALILTVFLSWAQDHQRSGLLIPGLEEMRTMVLIFGLALVVISFVWGYYLRSSKARLYSGVIGCGVLIIYGYAVLLTGGFSNVLGAMGWVLPPLVAFGIVCYLAVRSAFKFDRDYLYFRSVQIKTRQEASILKPALGRGEFDRRLGNPSAAASTAGALIYRPLVRWALIFLLLLFLLSVVGFGKTASEVIYLDVVSNICAVILLMGIPMTALAWLKGFYPKGSISRATFDISLSVMTVLMIFLIFAATGLPEAARAASTNFPLAPIGIALVLWASIDVLRAIGAFRDERGPWKKRIGYEVPMKKRKWRVGPESSFYDFNPDIGKTSRGLMHAQRTFFWTVALPEILILLLLGAARAGGNTSGPLFDAMVNVVYVLPIYGLILSLISFGRGFYPAGSLGRMFIGLLYVPGFFLYVFGTFLTPAVENTLRDRGLIVPFDLLTTLVIISILFVGFLQVAEMVDARRAWKLSVGKQTKPLKHIEKMTRLQEFRFRFGSVYQGSRWARKGMVRYLYYTTIILIILITIIGSLALALAGFDLSPLEPRLRQTYLVVIIVAIPLATVRAFYGFYPAGSTSKLTCGLLVALVGATYTYFALQGGTLAKGAGIGSVSAGISVDLTTILIGFLIGWGLYSLTVIAQYLSYRKAWIASGYQPVAAEDVAAKKREEKMLEREEMRMKKATDRGISVAELESEEAPDQEAEVEEEIKREMGEDALHTTKGAGASKRE